MMDWMKRRLGKVVFGAIVALIVFASGMAYGNAMPAFVGEIRHLDKVLHFTIFGMLTFGVMLAWGDPRLQLGRLSLPLAVIVPLAFAATEEALQGLSPHRHLDAWDLFCDAAGMLLCWLLFRRYAVAKHTEFAKAVS